MNVFDDRAYGDDQAFGDMDNLDGSLGNLGMRIGRAIASGQGAHDYTITIANTSSTDTLGCYLFSGQKTDSGELPFGQGTLKTGSANRGFIGGYLYETVDNLSTSQLQATGTLNVTTPQGSLQTMATLFKNRPVVILGMRISCSNAAQLASTEIQLKEIDTFLKKGVTRNIRTSTKVDPYATNATVLDVLEKFVLDELTTLGLSILPSTTMTITFVCGPQLNNASVLRRALNEAGNAAAGYGAPHPAAPVAVSAGYRNGRMNRMQAQMLPQGFQRA